MGENDAVANKCKTPPEKVIPPNINFWTEKEAFCMQSFFLYLCFGGMGAEIISQEG